MVSSADEFYLRYYCGHKGQFGHEYLAFEIFNDGRLFYTNNSQYKKDGKIEKELYLNDVALKEVQNIVQKSSIVKEDDEKWPEPDRVGRQELEVVLGNHHIAFTTSKIGTMVEVSKTKDPVGLQNFYYLVQDLRSFVLAVVALHFKIKPI